MPSFFWSGFQGGEDNAGVYQLPRADMPSSATSMMEAQHMNGAFHQGAGFLALDLRIDLQQAAIVVVGVLSQTA